MKKVYFLSWVLFIYTPFFTFGQAPATDIYLFDVALINGRVNYQSPLRITDRAGYDNQPFFLPDNSGLLFTSDRDDSSQTDIYLYHFAKKSISRLTETPESEYSPQAVPGKRKFTVVRVEADGETQRIWQFPLHPQKIRPPKVLMSQVDKVGYYARPDVNTMIVFRLPEPFRLEQRLVYNGKLQNTICRNVGRSLHVIPDQYAITYVDKSDPDHWMIKKLGLMTGKTTVLVETLAGKEDFCWSPDGYMLMGKEGKLYMFIPGQDEGWRFVGDLGIGDFYRLAVSADGSRLAVVGYREE